MESKTNYFVVGLLVLILTAGLIIVGLWLSVGFDQKKYNTYRVNIDEPVSGLTTESPVKYNGVKVGYIAAIQLNEANPQEVKLLVQIEAGTPITTTTEATLIMQGITGTTYLGLSATTPNATLLAKKSDAPYPVIPFKSSFFNRLEKNINDVTVAMNRFFDKDNAKNVKKTIVNLQKISSIIEKNNANLNKSLKDLPLAINELKVSLRQFGKMSEDISDASTQVSSAMLAGKNSMDKFSQQAIPPAVLLLRRLDLIAANLEKTSAQLRQNPAVIIRGNTPPKPGPGE